MPLSKIYRARFESLSDRQSLKEYLARVPPAESDDERHWLFASSYFQILPETDESRMGCVSRPLNASELRFRSKFRELPDTARSSKTDPVSGHYRLCRPYRSGRRAANEPLQRISPLTHQGPNRTAFRTRRPDNPGIRQGIKKRPSAR